MKFKSIFVSGMPIYVEPDFQDILELAKDNPDTVRICEGNGYGPKLAVASGYGNTHETIVKTVRALGDTKWNPSAYILHRERSKVWLMNSDGAFCPHGYDAERLTFSLARRYLSDELCEFWQEFAKEATNG